MARLIITFVLIIGLVSLAVTEQIFIKRTYDTLDKDLDSLSANVYASETISTTDNIDKINSMYNGWLKKEKKLCLVARHSELSQISDSLIYIKNFVYFNNKEEACVGIEKLKYLIATHSHNIGTSIQNVI